MHYSQAYIQSKDIDWFFKLNNQYVHVASAGGDLPSIINDRDKLRRNQNLVYNLPYIFPAEKILINEIFIRQLLSSQLEDNEEIYNLYLESFLNFARKGFISCDRTYIENDMSDLYHVVCMPPSFDNNINIEDIPIIKSPNCHLDFNCSNLELLKIVKRHI